MVSISSPSLPYLPRPSMLKAISYLLLHKCTKSTTIEYKRRDKKRIEKQNESRRRKEYASAYMHACEYILRTYLSVCLDEYVYVCTSMQLLVFLCAHVLLFHSLKFFCKRDSKCPNHINQTKYVALGSEYIRYILKVVLPNYRFDVEYPTAPLAPIPAPFLAAVIMVAVVWGFQQK